MNSFMIGEFMFYEPRVVSMYGQKANPLVIIKSTPVGKVLGTYNYCSGNRKVKTFHGNETVHLPVL